MGITSVEVLEMAGEEKKEHWGELYRKALFEEDRNKLPVSLEQAHKAVQQRARELWYSPTDSQNTDKERRELDAADYFIGLLQSLEARQQWPA
jgi:hypothetical protein